MAELARHMRALAASRQRKEVSAGICNYPPLVEALRKAGYAVNPDHFSLWVLELNLINQRSEGDA